MPDDDVARGDRRAEVAERSGPGTPCNRSLSTASGRDCYILSLTPEVLCPPRDFAVSAASREGSLVASCVALSRAATTPFGALATSAPDAVLAVFRQLRDRGQELRRGHGSPHRPRRAASPSTQAFRDYYFFRATGGAHPAPVRAAGVSTGASARRARSRCPPTASQARATHRVRVEPEAARPTPPTARRADASRASASATICTRIPFRQRERGQAAQQVEAGRVFAAGP